MSIGPARETGTCRPLFLFQPLSSTPQEKHFQPLNFSALGFAKDREQPPKAKKANDTNDESGLT